VTSKTTRLLLVLYLYCYVKIDDELFTFRIFVWCINLHRAINRYSGRDLAGKDGAPKLIFRSSILQGVTNFIHNYGVFKQPTKQYKHKYTFSEY